MLIGSLADNAHTSYLPGLSGNVPGCLPIHQTATWTRSAKRSDNILGTADDHPLHIGSNGVGGGDDLDDDRIDMLVSSYIAHGYLAGTIQNAG